MSIYFSANFNSPADGDDLNTYTPEVGSIFSRASSSGTDNMVVTSGRARAGTLVGRSKYYSTTEPQTDIDLNFDIRTVTTTESSSEAGVIARWDEGTGAGFGCYLKQTSSTQATLNIINWLGVVLSQTTVSISASTTYHVKWQLRTTGGSTTHKVYWNNASSPTLTVTSSAGPQVVGKSGVEGFAATATTGFHLDNVVASTFTQTLNSYLIFF